MRISTSQMQQAGIGSIVDQQVQINKLQRQIASGSKLMTAADNPADMARVSDMENRISQLEQFRRNADAAESHLANAENILAGMTGILQRVRELAIQANNATQSVQTRNMIGIELRGLFQEALQLANTRDADGNHIFAGFNGSAEPYLQQADGTISYRGDSGYRNIQIGVNARVTVNDPGLDIFSGIRSGNGRFLSAADGGNAGNGIISSGTINNPAALTGHDYRIVFTTASTYDVINETSLTTIATAQSWGPDMDVVIDGMTVNITGSPATGDSFTLTPARRQDIFTVIDQIAGLLDGVRSGPATAEQFQDRMQRLIADLDRADTHIVGYRAILGTRLNMIDNQRDMNDEQAVQLQGSLSLLRDLDYASAIGYLSLQLSVLEAAQQAYLRIQNLSLFNHLR